MAGSSLTRALRPFATPKFHLIRFGPRVTPQSHFPHEWPAVYGWPKLTRTRAKRPLVAIAELGGEMYSGDNSFLVAKIGTHQAPNINLYTVAGGSSTNAGAADGEVALDVQVALGVSYALLGEFADIALIFAPNSDAGMVAATRKAAELGADALSWSWGSMERNWNPATIDAMNAAFQACLAAGCDVTAASGDNDSGDGGPGDNCDFPASSPLVIGCGGTTTIQGMTGALQESVWNDGSDGTGGGLSAVFPLPVFQQGFLTGSGRGVPDLAGPADPATGWICWVKGQQQAIGGTSAVAPLIATLIACAKAAGYVAPAGGTLTRLYGLPASSFNDCTSGNNGSYKAQPGYDLCTGRGTPGRTFLADLIGAPVTPPPVVPPTPPVPVSGPTLTQAETAAVAAIDGYASHFGWFAPYIRGCEPGVIAALARLWGASSNQGVSTVFHALNAGDKTTFQGVYQQIIALINQYGPLAKPYIQQAIATAPLPIWAKAALTTIADILLSGNLPAPAPVGMGGFPTGLTTHAFGSRDDALPVTIADVQADLQSLIASQSQLAGDQTTLGTAQTALTAAQGSVNTAQAAVAVDSANQANLVKKLQSDAVAVFGPPAV